MDLHHTSGRPDWAAVPAARRRQWQRLAARTGGVLTPGNLITVAGFILVLIGLVCILQHTYWWGLALIATGRLGDILDGLIAEATGTKSPLGEALDATLDKAGGFVALVVFAIAGVISAFALAFLLLPHLAITVVSLVARRRAIALHPLRIGKLCMAASWAALLCFILASAVQLANPSWLRMVGDGLVAAAFVLGVVAATSYLRTLKSADL